MYTDITNKFVNDGLIYEWPSGNIFGKYEKIISFYYDVKNPKLLYDTSHVMQNVNNTICKISNCDLSYKEGFLYPVIEAINNITYNSYFIPVVIENCICDKGIIDKYNAFSKPKMFVDNLSEILDIVKKTCILVWKE